MADDTFGFAMEGAFSSVRPSLRKSRRSSKPVDPSGPALSEMFLGVTEMQQPNDDAVSSQRSEGEDQHVRRPTVQRQSSRASRSGGGGASKKKSTSATATGAPAPSASKKRAQLDARHVVVDELGLRENTAIARQHLTSSASRVRPSKQQQAQATQAARPTTRQLIQTLAQRGAVETNYGGNNNEENDEPVVDEERGLDMASGGSHSSAHCVRGRAEWEVLYGVNQAGQLPTRRHPYLNYSAGSDAASEPALSDDFPVAEREEDSPLSGLHADRPPSRQCHAFPTHLLDARDFFSPAKHHDGTASINITPWHTEEDDEEERDSPVSRPEQEAAEDAKPAMVDVVQRPPSRYMTKVGRGSTSSSSASSSSPGSDETISGGRLPSRRGAGATFNQTAPHYHDPKTDGFADVDESVPPPFRVEISTDSYRSHYIPGDHERADDGRRHSLKSRHSSSFGTRAQLNKLQQQQTASEHYAGLVESVSLARGAKRATTTRQSKLSPPEPQWFGYEPEPAAPKPDVDAPPNRRPAVTTRCSRNFVQPSGARADNNSSAHHHHHHHQWFRSSTNPFFLSPSPPVDDAMDDDTAIANTPLFSGKDDLMAMTQLTDLRLDDFMGDPYVLASSAVNTIGTKTSVAGSTSSTSDALNTSLGKDFLSLFAQH